MYCFKSTKDFDEQFIIKNDDYDYDLQEYESVSSNEYDICKDTNILKHYYLKYFTDHYEKQHKLLNQLYWTSDLDNIMCVVCMSNKIETLFSPCCHLITCQKCSKQIKKCCICKEKIKGKVKVYTPFN